MDMLANIAFGLTVIICSFAIIIVFIGVRNSILAGRSHERTKNSGKESTARITHAQQHDNQKVEGVLVLHLQVEFEAAGMRIATGKDVIVKIFDADNYKAGREITIRYMTDDPTKIVVMGDVRN